MQGRPQQALQCRREHLVYQRQGLVVMPEEVLASPEWTLLAKLPVQGSGHIKFPPPFEGEEVPPSLPPWRGSQVGVAKEVGLVSSGMTPKRVAYNQTVKTFVPSLPGK